MKFYKLNNWSSEQRAKKQKSALQNERKSRRRNKRPEIYGPDLA